MARTEMANLKCALNMPSSSGRLTRLRMLLVAIEGDPGIGSKRLFDGLRKGLNAIVKAENLDNELIATSARLLIRLDRIDPWRKRKKKQAEAETNAATLAKLQQTTPQPTQSELAQRMKLYEEVL